MVPQVAISTDGFKDIDKVDVIKTAVSEEGFPKRIAMPVWIV